MGLIALSGFATGAGVFTSGFTAFDATGFAAGFATGLGAGLAAFTGALGAAFGAAFLGAAFFTAAYAQDPVDLIESTFKLEKDEAKPTSTCLVCSRNFWKPFSR